MDQMMAEPRRGVDLPLPVVDRTRPAATTARRALLLLPALILAGAAGWWLAGGRKPATPALPASEAARLPAGTIAARPEPGTVVALGRLLPRSRILTIAPPFGAGDARIARLPVEEGQEVAEGAVLAVLDSEPMLRAALASAEASLAARTAALAQTRVQVGAAREDALAALARAEAALPILRRDYDRAADLAQRGAATEQLRDQRRLALEQAQQDAARARAALARYDSRDPEAQVDVVVARRTLESAIADRDRAQADLDKAIIRAPMAGTVLTLYARPGERPAAQGLMTFGATADMIAELEIYEDQVPALRPGAAVTLGAAALPRPLEGRLGRVGTEVLRQILTDTSPAANTDARVVRAVVELDAASAALAARLAGLQVTARIALR